MKNKATALDVISSALSLRDKKDARSLDVRKKYLRHFAELICRDIKSRRYSGDEGIVLSLCDSYSLMLSGGDIVLSRRDIVMLSDMLAKMLNLEKSENFGAFSIESGRPPRHLCYVKNYFSDSAFAIFDKKKGTLRCDYADSFESAALSVFYGQYDGCILPFESDVGQAMTGILKTVYKLGLKKSAICNVLSPSGQTTKFGIFTRELIHSEHSDMIDMIVESDDMFVVSDIISSSRDLGATQAQSYTFDVSGEKRTVISLKGSRAFEMSFLTFLTLYPIRYDVAGCYGEIKTSENKNQT